MSRLLVCTLVSAIVGLVAGFLVFVLLCAVGAAVEPASPDPDTGTA